VLIRSAAVPLLLALTVGCRSAAPLDDLFTDLHRRGLFDGAVVVSDRHGVVFAKGYGFANVERRVPFTPATATDGASLAKTFTAALLLALEHDGVLRLDDPARKYLPELPYPAVTLRHLLSHSSGIPVSDYDYFDAYLPRGEIRTTEVLLRVLAEQKPPLAAPPGTAFEYSSFCYDLAALAAARAAGKPYFALLDERFFRPLGITSAFARPGRLRDFPAVRTLGYRRGAVNDVFDFEAFHGGSNLYISAEDLDRWNRWFLRAPPAEALRYAAVGGAQSGLTLGSWYRDAEGTRFWYSGHLQGFHDEVFRDMQRGWSIVYVSNNTIEPWLQKGVVRAAVAALEGKRPRLTPPEVDDIKKEERSSLAGTFAMPRGAPFVVESDGGRLFALHNGIRYRIVQIAPNAFYIPGLDPILGFTKSGAIYVSSNVGEQWGMRTVLSFRR
jgi:CubicO group peptidase (beta-lactamase class C family)